LKVCFTEVDQIYALSISLLTSVLLPLWLSAVRQHCLIVSASTTRQQPTGYKSIALYFS